jgi:hypothetical protein
LLASQAWSGALEQARAQAPGAEELAPIVVTGKPAAEEPVAENEHRELAAGVRITAASGRVYVMRVIADRVGTSEIWIEHLVFSRDGKEAGRVNLIDVPLRMKDGGARLDWDAFRPREAVHKIGDDRFDIAVTYDPYVQERSHLRVASVDAENHVRHWIAFKCAGLSGKR